MSKARSRAAPNQGIEGLIAATLDMSLDERTIRAARDRAIEKKMTAVYKAKQVDFCIVMDVTGSMGPHLQACTESILSIVEYIGRINRTVELRFGFVGYRDYGDGDDALVKLDFRDDDGRAFRSMVGNLEAFGGDDGPEDVLGGLDEAVSGLSWSGGTRVILHVGDAPPHGRIFTKMPDDYPKGDPHGLTADQVLDAMTDAKIFYYFGKINDTTNRMISIFESCIGKITTFKIKSVDPKILVDQFVKASVAAIVQSVSLTSTIGSNAYFCHQKALELDPEEPDWDYISAVKGIAASFSTPDSITQVKSTEYWTKGELSDKACLIQKAPNPFAEGGERFAFYGRNLDEDMDMVLKEFKELGPGANSFEKYMECLEKQGIAKYLAYRFNKRLSESYKKVKFLPAWLLKTKTLVTDRRRAPGASTRQNRYYIMEQRLHGVKFRKFNCNSGIITEFVATLEAFAHYSYQITNRYLVVTDLQGGEYDNAFWLTDPAIHCVDNLRFGSTNFGSRGIDDFFVANHVCNSVCRLTGLDPINTR